MNDLGYIIGIAGGIGSGKSVVSRMLRLMGHAVYDCDSEARRLMEGSDAILDFIAREISPEAVTEAGGSRMIDRGRLAAVIFSDATKRHSLDAVVHAAVREDVARRACSLSPDGTPLFVESAILATGGLAAMCRRIWIVDTPDREIRLERIMTRSGCSREEAEARMRSQAEEAAKLQAFHPETVMNAPDTPLMPQIRRLLLQTEADRSQADNQFRGKK